MDIQNYIQEHKHICDTPILRNFVSNLSRYCTFLGAWDKKGERGFPASEMGYTRSDYDSRNRKWWTTPHSVNKDLQTPARAKEIDEITDAMQKAFPDLNSLGDFCVLFAEDLRRDEEYNLYYRGRCANYWIRCIIRNRDYNLYVHSIIPEQEVG